MNDKIRLWDTENKIMIYPKTVPKVNHNGDYDKFGYEDFAFNLNGDLLIKDSIDWSLTYLMANDEYAKRYIKMKNIGIEDKNMVDVYEYDIIKWYFYDKPKIFVIKWNDNNCCFKAYDKDDRLGNYFVYINSQNIEILGNSYEHPELLEGI